ncbi:Endothelin-converting enzyme 1 [Bulinus truncatus]|nr:Endothelin-converting enzyme 1 [Bulinus truncatus]
MSMSVLLLTVLVVNFCTALVRSEVCLSDTCRNVSQYILSNLNTSVDPCMDMYTYSCGGWMERHDIPEFHSKWTSFFEAEKMIDKYLSEILEEEGWVFKGRQSTAVRKIKQLYKSCIDVQTIERKGAEPLLKLIEEYGSWTVTPTNRSWNRRTWNLQEALQRAHNLTGTSFWGMSIDKDPKNESRNILQIAQYGLTLPDKYKYYTKSGVRDQFMFIASNLGRLLGGCNETVRDKMYEIYQLELSLLSV